LISSKNFPLDVLPRNGCSSLSKERNPLPDHAS
jgi:hypothetical protein